MGRKILQGLGIGCLAAGLALALHFARLLDGMENMTWDLRVRHLARPAPTSGRIRLILIDQTSLDWAVSVNAWKWPWPRAAYGAIVDFCRRGGARVFASDLLFSEPSLYGVDDDQVLTTSILKTPGYVQAVFLSREQGTALHWPTEARAGGLRIQGAENWLALPAHDALRMPRASFPIPEITAAAPALGSVYATSDPDAIVRRTALFQSFDGRLVPSLGVAAWAVDHSSVPLRIDGDRLDVGGTPIDLDEAGNAVLRYRGPSQTHQAVNAAAVIQSELLLQEGKPPTVDPAQFKDAYVFLGSTAPGLLDLKPTPISAVYPGVEIHATVLDNLLAGDFIRPLPPWAVLAAVLLFGGAAGAAGRACSTARSAALSFLLLLPLPFLAGLGGYAQGFWIPVAAPLAAVFIALLSATLLNYAVEGRQRRFIKSAFRQYLSPVVIEQLVKNPGQLQLGGVTRELTIYFSDVQGFTGISEGLKPQQLTGLLNEYLTAMTDIILESGGAIDKYEGDAIIAFWNAPLDLPDHAVRGLRSALLCQKRLAEIRPLLRQKYGPDVFCRIGLNTGTVVVGNMGSHQRFDYTFLGDAGNLASRLEGINKQFDTPILVSEATFRLAGDAVAGREISRVRVVGRREPVRVFQPCLHEDFPACQDLWQSFDRGLQHYYAGRFDDAVSVFARTAEADPAAARYLAKCRTLAAAPPPAWDGVWEMTEK